jgi:hypothetical protein
VTWEKFFVSGAPRIASVSLSFAQVPQYQGQIAFPSASWQMNAAFKGFVGDFAGYQQSYLDPQSETNQIAAANAVGGG